MLVYVTISVTAAQSRSNCTVQSSFSSAGLKCEQPCDETLRWCYAHWYADTNKIMKARGGPSRALAMISIFCHTTLLPREHLEHAVWTKRQALHAILEAPRQDVPDPRCDRSLRALC